MATTFTRRKLFPIAIAASLEFIALTAEGKSPSLVRIPFAYQTILGNAEDVVSSSFSESGEIINICSTEKANSSSSQEEAAINSVKSQRVVVTLDRNQIKNERYTKYVLDRLPQWNARKKEFVVQNFDYARYVVKKDAALLDLVHAVTHGYPILEEKAQALLCFVQTAIPYDYPKVAALQEGTLVDYVRDPRRTLLDAKGDCKDKSVLYASLLAQLHIPAVFLMYPRHINVGVELDFGRHPSRVTPPGLELDGVVEGKYYIAETTTGFPAFIGKMLTAQKELALQRILPI